MKRDFNTKEDKIKNRSEEIVTSKRGRRNTRGGRDEQTKSAVRPSAYTNCDNDPKWYAANEQLLRDAFSLPTNNQLGTPLQLSKIGPAAEITTTEKYITAGICILNITPCPGISTHDSSPVNLAAHKLYAWIRHANSGSKCYDAADLMMYILAMDNAYTLWNALVRIYGLIRTYNQKNRYMPRHLVRAMGFDFDNLERNLSNFRMLINSFSSRLSTFAVPNNFTYITRHQWLFQNVYTDAPEYSAQLYAYSPSYLFYWVEKTADGALGYLQPVKMRDNTNLWTVDELAVLINDFIDPITTSEDFNIMSGDIIKAYGLNNLITIPMINEDFQVLPVYSEEVLMQIENARAIGGIVDDEEARITQSDSGGIRFCPKLTVDKQNMGTKVLLNFHSDSVSPSDISVATRLIPVFDSWRYAQDTADTYLDSCGSEILQSVEYRHIRTDSFASCRDYTVTHAYKLGGADHLALLLGIMEQFRFHPILLTYSESEGNYTLKGIHADLNNTVVTDLETIDNMHEVALLSQFDVPQVAGS